VGFTLSVVQGIPEPRKTDKSFVPRFYMSIFPHAAGHGTRKYDQMMKKGIIISFAWMLCCIHISKADEPKPTKIKIDDSCPASVTVNTLNSSEPATRTENNSKGYDARTTVTDQKGNQMTYHTPPQSATRQVGGTIIEEDKDSSYGGNNSYIQQIEVDCSPVEKE